MMRGGGGGGGAKIWNPAEINLWQNMGVMHGQVLYQGSFGDVANYVFSGPGKSLNFDLGHQ